MLKPEILELIRNSKECVVSLMLQNDLSERTIINWTKTNHEKLAIFDNLMCISVALKIPVQSLLATKEVAA